MIAWVLVFGTLWVRRRDAAAARARHEVRGPLAIARVALGGLERSARVDAIDRELRRASLALDDLERRRRTDTRPVDVGSLIADAEAAWAALAEEHGAALVVEPASAFVEGDPLRLAQAAANVVTNAVEHGGGHVHVRVEATAGHVRVVVADDGPGLPAALPALIAAARGRRSHRGHGLAIAAAIARRHRGRLLSLPSERGAHVALELPRARGRP